MRIGALWNKLANPKNVPRIFAFSLGIILLIGFIVPMSLNPDQIYPPIEATSVLNVLIIGSFTPGPHAVAKLPTIARKIPT